MINQSMWFNSGILTSPVSVVHRFRILVVGKVSLCNIQSNPSQTDVLITERLREVLAYQCCFQGGHVGAYSVLFQIPIHSPYLCLENKAAPARVSDINFAFRPDDNHHLIVHESAGLEPGDAQGLRAVRDFISNRTDPSRAPAERLHAIW